MVYTHSSRSRRAVTRLGAAGAVACAVAAGVLASTGAAHAVAAPRVLVPGTSAPSAATAHRTGSLAAGARLSVAVSLALHDPAGLAAFEAAVSTPGSALYGHYLSSGQFAQRFGPSAADVAAVRQFLVSSGLRVTDVSGNRQVVDASGTAAQVSAAFGTSLGEYSDGARSFFANDHAASLPAGVASVIAGVTGLNNRSVNHPAATAGAGVSPHAGPVGGFSPAQIDGAYRFNQMGTDGTGTTVALWEFDGYKSSDLTTYNSQYGLTGPTATTVSVDGANYDSAPGDGEVEVELDSEVVRAVAPKATQLVYEAPNSDQGEIDMANKIVSDGRAKIISISWGECEQDSTSAAITGTNNAFSQAVAQGISMFSAAGDDGSRDCARTPTGSGVKAVDFPGSSVYDTSVGGTTLTLGSGSTYGSESTWSDGGGGVSTLFAKPSWQTGSGSFRTVPDVSSNADPNSGFSEFTGGSWTEVGGTSAAAPTWAGYTALYDQKAVAAGKANLGFANPAIYTIGAGSGYHSAFHDVTSGSNGDYSATAGYDDATGWGSPIADGLATALLGGGSTGGNTVTVTNPGNQSTVVGASVSVSVHASDSASGTTLTYSAAGLPAGLSISSSTGVISGAPTTVGSSTVTVTVKDNTGATGSASFTWTVTSAGGGGGCSAPGQKLGNPGFESGNTTWAASSGVIGQYGSQGEPTHAGSWDAWLDGYGSTHTDTLSQSVTIPAGCAATLSFYLHIDTAETTKSTAYDTFTVKVGSTTLATFSNLNAAAGYTVHSYNLASFAGQTVTLLFTGKEDSSLQTSFVVDDASVAVS
jgi:subtilase family serine protease